MDRRISIEHYTTVPDDYGNDVPTWAEMVNVWAAVQQESGREFIQAAAVTPERRVVFRIRWMEGITTAHRVNYGGRQHNIHEVRELGRREGIELHTIATGA
jgi:SPP1 family predicted phage head-tail adaptor